MYVRLSYSLHEHRTSILRKWFVVSWWDVLLPPFCLREWYVHVCRWQCYVDTHIYIRTSIDCPLSATPTWRKETSGTHARVCRPPRHTPRCVVLDQYSRETTFHIYNPVNCQRTCMKVRLLIWPYFHMRYMDIARGKEKIKDIRADNQIWTSDLSSCNRLLYHWAIPALHDLGKYVNVW